MSDDAKQSLKYAKEHLERVQNAWDNPTDWSDLSIYGFYCLEAAVKAAILHYGLPTTRRHYRKAEIAKQIADQYNLPDISDLLIKLNAARKATAYGDVDFPEELDAQDTATKIEEYVDAVYRLIEGGASKNVD